MRIRNYNKFIIMNSEPKSIKVIILPPDKNIPEGKLFSQDNRELGMVLVCHGSFYFVDLPPASDRETILTS